eukprot:SAG31_NODE_1692_length_7512_cov_4.735465_1_plen_49_part_10
MTVSSLQARSSIHPTELRHLVCRVAKVARPGGGGGGGGANKKRRGAKRR